MQTRLAWRNLIHHKMRLLAITIGITFVVTLIFAQIGMQAAVLNAAVLVFNRLNFDIALISPQYIYLRSAGTLPHHRLYQASTIEAVQQAMPLYVSLVQWKHAQTGELGYMQMLGYNPHDPVFQLPDLDAQTEALRQPNVVFMDRRARPAVGPKAIGVSTEVQQHQIRIGGHFTLGSGFTGLGTLIVSDVNFSRIRNGFPLNQVSLGLITVVPEAEPADVAQRLRRLLPADVQVLTRAEMKAYETDYWRNNTPSGIVLGAGVLMACLVGTVVIYQVLATDISHRLSEYATLKALGYKDGYISSIVLQQALMLAIMGFIPGLAFSFGVYEVLARQTHFMMDMPPLRIVAVIVMSTGMCTLSGLLALQKLKKSDPAELF